MESTYFTALTTTSAIPPLTPDDYLRSPPETTSRGASHIHSPHTSNTGPLLNSWQQSHLIFGSSSASPHAYTGQGGYAPLMPSDSISCQDPRPSPLDRQWLSLSVSHATSGTQFPSMPMTDPHAPPDGSLTLGGALEIAPVPHLSPSFHTYATSPYSASNLGADVYFPPLSARYHSFAHQTGHPAFGTSNAIPLSSPRPVRNFAHHEQQPPVVIYCPPEKKASGRRCHQRACAIKIEGMWIDKDDLYMGTVQDNSIISVHECQWAKYNNPCGMWIVGSRSHVGAHIRKWHTQMHAENSRTNCLWDGCTTDQVMLKNSINRHVVSVHLGEAFHCQGCPKVFPRSDVYDKHVENSKGCREVGATIVYDTERKAIDACRALKGEENEVHYAD